MKTLDIKFHDVVKEMEKIENEAGIQLNNHRKNIARHIINHFVKEHIPKLKPKDPPFIIPKELQDDTEIESSGDIIRSEGTDILGQKIS
jgi:hypothetical protein